MQPSRESVLTILAPALIFLSGFLNYIIYHDYGIFTPEVLLCIAWLACSGLVVGGLLATAGPTNLRAFGFILLLFAFFDVQFKLFIVIMQFVDVEQLKFFRYVILIAVFFVVQLVVLGLRKHIAAIISTVFATAMIAILVIPVQKLTYGFQHVSAVNPPRADLPAVIHVVLDGHIGIEGIPLDIEGGKDTRERLINFYHNWGFRLYGRAYSKYFMTYNALSSLMDGAVSGVDVGLVDISNEGGKQGWKLAKNSYFRKFSNSGYRIRVFQSSYLDFCRDSSSAVESCYQYSSSSPRLIRELNLPVAEKTGLIMGGYLGNSAVIYFLNLIYSTARNSLAGNQWLSGLPEWNRKESAFSSLGIPEEIERLKEDILQSPRGRLFFAHMLLPHGPYVWNSKCQLQTDTDSWLSRRMNHNNLLATSNPEYRNKAYKNYFQQINCTVSLLDDLLESINREGVLKNATVIIHGDHGSRITITDPVLQMAGLTSDRDYIDAFSTLFAIRAPDIDAGYNEQSRSIQNLFAELMLDVPVPRDDGQVFLRPKQRSPGLLMETGPMPPF